MKKKISEVLQSTAKSFDAFGTPIKLTLNGEHKHKTYLGSVMSILVLTITLLYASFRWKIMRDYGDNINAIIYERKTVPLKDPIRMDDAQMNLAYSIQKQESNGERVPIVLDGYLEINLTMRQWKQ